MNGDLHKTARPGQIPPEGNWKTWHIEGGRGSGKTWALAQWVKKIAQTEKHILIISLSLSPRDLASMYFLNDNSAVFDASRERLFFPHGESTAPVITGCFGDANKLRGCQFDAIAFDDMDLFDIENPDHRKLAWTLQNIVPDCKKLLVNCSNAGLAPNDTVVYTALRPSS